MSGIIVLLVCTLFSCVLSASVLNVQIPSFDNIPQCQQPPVPGMCLAYLHSFFYNASTGTCQDFVYGGCQGNENRFVTKEECQRVCGGSQAVVQGNQDVCSLPKVSGLCYASFQKFYFNGEKCEMFTYGGCGGNKNNFETEEECVKACPPLVRESRETTN